MYKEIYKSYGFTINNKGLAIFDSVPPFGCGYWGRFFTMEEIRKLESSETPLKDKISIMHTSINRAHNNAPCYTGDIRYRPR